MARCYGRHTAENIAYEVRKILQLYDITQKVVSVTGGNASNGKKAINELRLNYLPCFGHDINLIINGVMKSVEEIEEIKEKVGKIVSLTGYSPTAR